MTAPIVNLLFELNAERHSFAALARCLYDEGIASPTGKSKRTTSRMRNLLANEAYTGKFTGNRTTRSNYKQKDAGRNGHAFEKPRDEWPVIVNDHEAICSERLFRAAEKSSKDAKKHCKIWESNRMFILSGRLTCAHCGSSMSGWYDPKLKLIVPSAMDAKATSTSVSSSPSLRSRTMCIDPARCTTFRNINQRCLSLLRFASAVASSSSTEPWHRKPPFIGPREWLC